MQSFWALRVSEGQAAAGEGTVALEKDAGFLCPVGVRGMTCRPAGPRIDMEATARSPTPEGKFISFTENWRRRAAEWGSEDSEGEHLARGFRSCWAAVWVPVASETTVLCLKTTDFYSGTRRLKSESPPGP